MELMTRWTDDRMDDLRHQVGELSRRMDKGFAETRDEAKRTQEMIVGLHGAINGLHAQFARLSMTLVVAVIGLVAAQTGFILTQL